MSTTDAPRNKNEDLIQQVAARESQLGHTILKELTRVEQTPELTLRNVLKATDTVTNITCLALSLSFLSGIIGFTVPATQISFMVADLGDAQNASWISTAPSACIAALSPSASGLTDVLGRRNALLCGTALGVAGALISGFAPSTRVIIMGQIVTGCGFGIGASSTAAISEIVPAFTRPFWSTVQHGAGALGQIVGPIYAGALVKKRADGWRWVFYIDAIICAISFIVLFFTYNPTSRVKALGLSKKEIFKRFDYVGFVLLAGGIALFLVGLSSGGTKQFGWHSATALAPPIIGLFILLIGLPAYEYWIPAYPFMKRSLFRDRNFVIINLQTFVEGFVLVTSNVYLSQMFLTFWTKDPVLLGVDRLSMFGVVIVSQIGSGILFQKTGRYKWAYVFFAFLLFLGPSLFAILRPTQNISVPLGLSVFTGLAIGGVTQLSFAAIPYCVQQTELGIALGILSTARTLGGAVGVAIFNAILTYREQSHFQPAIITAAVKAGATESELKGLVLAAAASSLSDLKVAANGNMVVVKAVADAAKLVVSNAYRVVFLACIPFGLLSLVSTFFLREVTHYMNNETVFGVKHSDVVNDQSIVEKNEAELIETIHEPNTKG